MDEDSAALAEIGARGIKKGGVLSRGNWRRGQRLAEAVAHGGRALRSERDGSADNFTARGSMATKAAPPLCDPRQVGRAAPGSDRAHHFASLRTGLIFLITSGFGALHVIQEGRTDATELWRELRDWIAGFVAAGAHEG